MIFPFVIWAEGPDFQPEDDSISDEASEAEMAPAIPFEPFKPLPLPPPLNSPAVKEPSPTEPVLDESLAESLNPFHLKVGASLQNYRYEEPALMSHTGVLIGAWLDWLYKVPYYTGSLHAEMNTGKLDYNGALCDVNTGDCHEYKSKTNDVILRATHRFSFSADEIFQHPVQIFFGVGYRYLYDKGDGVGFYRRIGQYWILPVGFTTSVMWNELKTKVVFDYEFDYFLAGAIESKLSDVNLTYSDVKHLQNRGRAQRLIVGFEPQPEPDHPHPWMFYFFYENWSIPQSERAELLINGAHSGKFFYEPENRSNAYGIRVGWSY